MSKRRVGLFVPRIKRMTTIWDGVFFKLRVYFDGIVSRKKVFLESSHLIERHNDVVVEIRVFHSTVAFELCIYEEFIEFW